MKMNIQHTYLNLGDSESGSKDNFITLHAYIKKKKREISYQSLISIPDRSKT